MKTNRWLAMLFAAMAGTAHGAQPAPIEKAHVLPLVLSDDFVFKKTKLFLNDPKFEKPTMDRMIQFERNHYNFGAITNIDRQNRYGQYFTFFWDAKRTADLTLRLEYRQAKLGGHVQAREVRYPKAKGMHKTDFSVIGDDYLEDGRVTAWRAVLIQDGRIVALTQSYLWN